MKQQKELRGEKRMDIDKRIFEKWSQIDKRFKYSFFVCIIMGICAHLFIISGYYPNNDMLYCSITSNDDLTTGRWFLTYISDVSSKLTLPTVIGLIAIFFVALTSVYIIKIFDIRQIWIGCLCAMLLVTFPTISSAFSWMFTADAHMIAMFMGTFAVYIMISKSWKWLPVSMLLLGLSIGTYQSYLAFAMMLCLGYIILSILKEKDFHIFYLIGKFLVGGLGGSVVYLLGLLYRLNANNLELGTHKGVNQMGQMGIKEIVLAIKNSYWNVFTFLRGDYCFHISRWAEILYVMFFSIVLGSGIYLIARMKIHKKRFVMIVLLVAVGSAPIALSIVLFTSPSVEVYTLMIQQFVLIFVLGLAIFDMLYQKINKKEKYGEILSCCIMICCLGIVWQYVLIDNAGYSNLYFRYQKSYALVTKISMEIDQIKGMDGDTTLYMYGNPNSVGYPWWGGNAYISDVAGTEGGLLPGDNPRLHYMLYDFIGQYIPYETDQEVVDAIVKSEDFSEMPTWPEKGAIKKINNTVVIKMPQ